MIYRVIKNDSFDVTPQTCSRWSGGRVHSLLQDKITFILATWVQTQRHCRPSTIALQLSKQTRKTPRQLVVDKVSTEQRDQRFNP
jgi:hypothetical protein